MCKLRNGNVLEITLDLKVDGCKMTGTAESPAGRVSVDDGTYADGVVKFKATVDGNDYPHESTATADGELLGTIHFGEQLVNIKAGREAAPPSNPNSIPGVV